MSTDKLQAVSSTVAEILSEPPSPHSYFDEDPGEAGRVSEQVAKASDIFGSATEIQNENLGKVTRRFGISPNAIPDDQIVHDTGKGSVGIARQSLADQNFVAFPTDADQRPMLSHESAGARSDPRTTRTRFAAAANGVSLGGWALRGGAVVLMAACIGIAAVMWLRPSRDAAKTALSQPAPPAQIASVPAAVPSELTPLLQSISRDLASVGKDIEQLKASRELLARDNANLSQQLKASQEQMARVVAGLSEQLKANQEQGARDSANVAEQVKAIQDQLVRVVSQVSEPKKPPKIAATSPQQPSLTPGPKILAARKPTPIAPPALAAAKPKAERPKVSPTSRPPAPAR